MIKSIRASAIAVILLTTATAGPASAQDTHYWTQQYGTQGQLLLGTVVGSLLDLSAVYYNPGALGLQEKPLLILGARAFEYQTISFEDEEGNTSPLNTRSFGPAPTLFAAILPPRLLEGEIGFSSLTRQDFDFRVQAVGSGTLGVNPDSVVQVGGEIMIDQSMSEYWGGFTWARGWGKTGIGVSSYIAYRGQRTRYQTLFQGLRSDDTGASATYINEIDYWNVRWVLKFGAAWDYSPLTFGIAVTTPGIGLFGQGSSLINVFVNGVDLDEDGTPDTELVSNVAKDVPTDYKSPASIAGGIAYRYKNTTFHASAEWFDSVEEYEIMPTQYFESPTTGDTYEFRTNSELKSVFNWGIGIEQHIRDWLKAYGSFITDRSAYVEGTETNVSMSNWDLFHIMGGAAFTFLGTDITLGIGYSFGSDQFPSTRRGDGVNGDDDLLIDDVEATMEYRRWMFIVGFAFGASS
jgi:hypothetical protein